jgi:hypothetical protein
MAVLWGTVGVRSSEESGKAAGMAMPESRVYTLDPFTSLDVATGLHVVVTIGDTFSIRLESVQMGLLERIAIRVTDGWLRARHDGSLLDVILRRGFLNPANLGRNATLLVTMPKLLSVKASTGAEVEIESAESESLSISVSTNARLAIESVKAESLLIRASSSGRLSIGGVCESLTLKASSGSRTSAIGLMCTDVHIEGNNGAFVELTARGKVSGAIRSGTALHLNGRPKIIDVKSGASASLTFG